MEARVPPPIGRRPVTDADVNSAASDLQQALKNTILANRTFGSEVQRDESALMGRPVVGTSRDMPVVPSETLLDAVTSVPMPVPVGGVRDAALPDL